MRSTPKGTRARREFLAAGLAAGTACLLPRTSLARSLPKLKLRYILGSCMYGYTELAEILPEVAKTGATHIDIWPKVHGNQREQLDEMGEAKFAELLKKYDVQLGCITQYKLGPYGLADEFKLANRFGCPTIVTGGKGPKGLQGSELKSAVGKFIESMKPHVEAAAENGVTIAIENHGNNLIESPDSLRYLVELRPSKHLAVALAPYHLPQAPELLAHLIRDLGDGIEMFYAWQHGNGCMQAQPKETELLQMPGRGDLAFGPILEALSMIEYDRWMEIFMHPYPRGIPILPTTEEVSAEINRSREHLESLL